MSALRLGICGLLALGLGVLVQGALDEEAVLKCQLEFNRVAVLAHSPTHTQEMTKDLMCQGLFRTIARTLGLRLF